MVKQILKHRVCLLMFAVLIVGVVWIGCDQMRDSLTVVPSGGDPYEINAATISGDVLSVSVSFSGGCEAHEFTLGLSDGFLESNPVQLWAWLLHDAKGDSCEAYPTEERQFDLTPIKARYRQAYQQQEGVVIILLEGAPEGSLVYEF